MQVYWLKHKKRYIIFGISSNTWKWLHIVYEDDKLWNDYKPHLHMYTLNSSVIPLQTNVIFTSIYTILFIPYIFSHTHIHVHMYFISVFLSECEHEQVFFFYLQIKLPFIKKEEKKKWQCKYYEYYDIPGIKTTPQILIDMVAHTLYQELWFKTTMVSWAVFWCAVFSSFGILRSLEFYNTYATRGPIL